MRTWIEKSSQQKKSTFYPTKLLSASYICDTLLVEAGGKLNKKQPDYDKGDCLKQHKITLKIT